MDIDKAAKVAADCEECARHYAEKPGTVSHLTICDLYNAIARLARIIEEGERMNDGWQPIETAPKDRLLIVGFYNELGRWRSMHAQYRDNLPRHDDADADDEPAPAGWYEGSLEAEMLFPVRPSHWMPLPAPPSKR